MPFDARLATLAASAGVVAYVALVRDRRGPPPPPVPDDASVTAGLTLTIVANGAVSTRRFGKRLLVGRAPSADLRIDDPQVSRVHARIELRADEAYVQDLGSRNGTLVEGIVVTGSRRVAVGEEIQIGGASIIVRGVGAWR